MIKVNQVNKYFNEKKSNEIHVLNDVTLTFPKKGLVVILGASGSGKTTLLNVIGGLDSVKNGEIDFLDNDVSKYNSKVWDPIRNEHIGYVFQNYLLQAHLSVFDNVAFVLNMLGITDKEEVEKRVNYILRAVGMYPFRRKKALQLSGGQQQRVAIARALVKNPSLVIADEPTGNLDSKNTTDIMNIISKIAQEKLVVMVTHEKEIANFYANRIIIVVDGQIVNDYENIQTLDHGLEVDDAIYLKDLNKESDLNQNNLNVNLYKDNHDEQPIKVNLIVKNNTLYLDVDSNYQNVKLAKDHNVVIKDEHFVVKTKEDLSQTTFNLEELDTTNINKEKVKTVSVKRSFKYALFKVLSVGRKGKLMLASFILAGILIAFASSFLLQALLVTPDLNHNEDAVRIFYNGNLLGESVSLNYDKLMEIDPNAIVYPDQNASLSINTSLIGQQTATFNGTVKLSKELESKDYIGTLPLNENEIMVSQGLLKEALKDAEGLGIFNFSEYTGNDFGIWTEEQFLLESYNLRITSGSILGSSFTNEQVKVTGIVRSDSSNSIYLSDDGLYEIIRSYTFIEDTVPDNELIKEYYNNSNRIYVISSMRDEIIDKAHYNLQIDDLYAIEYEYAAAMAKEISAIVLPIALILVAFTFIGFYFVLRSSLISRVSEISIYRALGVNKSEIFSMFLIETFILTTFTSLIGYIIGSIGVYNLQKSLLASIGFMKINILSFLLGLIAIYGLNMIAGLLPVGGLLRKTPAHIMSKYDI